MIDSGRMPPRRWKLPRPHTSLRGRLLFLLLIATFPVIALVLAGAFVGYRGAIQQASQNLALERDLVVAAFAGRIASADGALRGIAGTWPPGSQACGEWLREAAPEGVAVLVECPGDPLTGLTGIGSDLRARMADATHSVVFAGASGIISVLRRLPVSGRLLLARVAPPVLPTGLLGWIVDAENRSWPLGDAASMAPPRAAVRDGTPVAAMVDGAEVVLAHGTLSSHASLVIARPMAPVRAAAALAATQRLALVGALLSLSILAVVLGANYAVARPLSRLRSAVAQWNAGAAPFDIPGAAGMPAEIRDLAESFQAGAKVLAEREQDLQAAIERAEILTAEVHHRVKNNLQIVSSLLALQAQRVTDGQARVEFEAARDRISALATLHRHMYAHHDPEAIDLGAFIEELGVQLFAAIGDKPGRRINLEVAAPALRISSDQAVPLALIITEAVSAALKQGFPPGQRGRIGITVSADERRASLVIEDDGVVPRPDDQLRAMLLRGLARQLGAELQRHEAGLALVFPLRPPNPRPPNPRPPPSGIRPKVPDPSPPPAPPGPSASA